MLRVTTGLLLGCSLAAAIATMPARDLRPGMQGHGLSVFAGDTIEEFGVEIVDVMPNVWPRGDMIIARLSGKGLEESGIVAGMSGSPVYIDGRLIGAVAYGWGFSRQPIAGITPIDQMLEVWRDSAPARTGGAWPGRSNNADGIARLPLPVAITGLTPRLAGLIGPELAGHGLQPFAASGRATGPADASKLIPGAAVGVTLVDGDVQMSGIGTLTARDGDRILAFGHPMFQAGRVRLPMIAGRIHTVLPSYASSFKLFSPGAEVGVVTEDRLPAIGGRIGPERAPMVPAVVTFTSPTRRDRYQFRVIEQEQLAPLLVASALADLIYLSEGSMEEMTLRSRLGVTFHAGADRHRFEVRHRFAGTDPAAALFRRTRQELDAVFGNDFVPVERCTLTFEIEFHPGIHEARLVDATPDRRRVRPGEQLELTLRLRDWRGAETDTVVRIRLPASLPVGELQLEISPPDTFLAGEMNRAPATVRPQTLSGLIDLLGRTGDENELVVAAFSRRPGITSGAAELPLPPPSLVRLLGGQDRGRRTYSSLLWQQRIPLGRIVRGSASTEIDVRR